MNDQLFFDFAVNKETNQILVRREFNAPLPEVWSAWTEPEILDQWWAPKPYQAITVAMDFKVGGRWFYFMLSPKEERHYCVFDFKEVIPLHYFSGIDAFCDQDQIISDAKPRVNWNNQFQSVKEKTLVSITLDFETEKDLEMIIQMGFKEGFTMGLSNLDEYLTLKNES